MPPHFPTVPYHPWVPAPPPTPSPDANLGLEDLDSQIPFLPDPLKANPGLWWVRHRLPPARPLGHYYQDPSLVDIPGWPAPGQPINARNPLIVWQCWAAYPGESGRRGWGVRL